MYKRLLSLGIILFVVAATAGGMPAARAESSGSISGTFINDLDADGEIDAGEKGLSGWHVLLEGNVGDDGTSVSYETKTDGQGKYVFSHLDPGTYVVSVPCEDQPRLHVTTSPSEQLPIELQSGNPQQHGVDMLLSLVDSPAVGNGTISGRVVWDENRDGVADPSEAGVAGWRVDAWLHGSECLPSEYQERFGDTTEGGSFRLSGVVPGRYSVGVIIPDRQGDYVVDSPGVERQVYGRDMLEVTNEVIVGEGESQSITLGVLSLKGSGSISGDLYHDLNLNGALDAGEPLMTGQPFIGLLYRTPNGLAVVFPPLAFDSGHYAFTGLAAGDWVVGVISLMGHGVNPPVAADGIPEASIALGEGEQRTGVDFGSDEQPPEQAPTGTPQPTPAPTQTPPVTPTAGPTSTQPIGAPVTGSGGPSAATSESLPGVAIAIATVAIGVVGLSLGMRRRTRRP
jgi:hypothetical protein